MQNRRSTFPRRRPVTSFVPSVPRVWLGGLVAGLVALASSAAPAALTSGSLTGNATSCLLGILCSPVATLPSGSGAAPAYWVAGSEGGVGAYGGTSFDGSMQSHPLAAPVVGMAATPDGGGYWLVARDGGVFAFGDAGFDGSMGGRPLAAPVVGIAATPDGKGYWLVGADGGVFSFGDARFHGSMGGRPLAAPVVGMAAAPGGGYWLVAADGGVFSFGDAPFHGSMGGQALNAPMVGMAATPDGGGYWLVGADGGVFSFGDARFRGSMGGQALNAPMVGMAATPDGGGYWTVAGDGGVFSFGDARFRGSAAGYVPNGEWITTMAEGPGSGSGTSESGDFSTKQVHTGPPYPSGQNGYDISWPQCGSSYPPRAPVAVVGANGGSAFTTNPCFPSEASWGGSALTIYLNLNSPQGSNSDEWAHGPAGNCATGDLDCESYNFGYNSAMSSIGTAHADGFTTGTWWLDVETGNYWTSDTTANDEVIAGALDALRQAGYASAIYSTSYQWSQIAGSYDPSVPAWYPTGQSTSSPGAWCASSSFVGGPVYLVQSAAGDYDGDYSC
jgi:hypothetical protein